MMPRLLLLLALLAAAGRGQDAEIERLLDALGSPAPQARNEAVAALRQAPDRTARALRLRIAPEIGRGPLSEEDVVKIRAWIADLGAEEFERREAAEGALGRVGRRVLEHLATAKAALEDLETVHRIEAVEERIEAQGTDDRLRVAYLEMLSLAGLLGDPSLSDALLDVVQGQTGHAAVAAHLALRALHPEGPALGAGNEALEDVSLSSLADRWRAHLAAEPPAGGEPPGLEFPGTSFPGDRLATARTEIANAALDGDAIPAGAEGRLAIQSTGRERSTFRETDRGGAPRVVERRYVEHEVTSGFRNEEFPQEEGGAQRLKDRTLRLVLGDPVLVEALPGEEPLGPGDKYLISLGTLLSATLPGGRYVRGRPVEMPAAAVLAFVPFIEDSVALGAMATTGRAVWLGRGEDGRERFACSWHFDVGPAPAGARTSRYRTWLAGRFEVDPGTRVVLAYEVEGILFMCHDPDRLDAGTLSVLRTTYRLSD